MKKGWVVFGSIVQLVLALFTLMMTVFIGGGFETRGGISNLERTILEWSILVLPSLFLLSLVIVIVKYSNKASARSYSWYLMPLLGWVAYLIYCSFL